MAEGAPLLRAYTLIAYRGFESLLLRQKKIPRVCDAGDFFCLQNSTVSVQLTPKAAAKVEASHSTSQAPKTQDP